MTPATDDGDVRLYHGDCREVMAQLPAASVQAVVTDPPYDLTSDVATRRSAFPGRYAETEGARRGFMGKEWDGTGVAFEPATWAAVLRLLAPGGHMLAFGGTRTWHRMVCAIEDAGFEIRDTITWHYGSGFPKSLDVSKAIDREAGAVREVVGVHPDAAKRTSGTVTMSGWATPSRCNDLTTPATPEAARWQGWGTALKPATELIVVARKPLAERTVARQVLATGTGGLNVDATRVPISQDGARSNPGGSTAYTCRERVGARGSHIGSTMHLETAGAPLGRPAPPLASESACGPLATPPLGSLAGCPACPRCGGELSHSGAGDVRGVARQPADVREPLDHQPTSNGSPSNQSMACTDYTAPDVQGRWPPNLLLTHDARCEDGGACVAGCPVAELDGQSGVLTSGSGMLRRNADKFRSTYGEFRGADEPADVLYGDTGGASRFFPAFRYEAKAAASERGEGNSHPTVKPVALMRWLIRLVTPPGGTVLDPFAGSGTTLIAARREGFRAVGIEREEEYLHIIKRRLQAEPVTLFAGLG